MSRVIDPEEMKHNILREILRSLGLAEKPESFSKGSTVRSEALIAIRDEIHSRRGVLKTVVTNLNALIEESL